MSGVNLNLSRGMVEPYDGEFGGSYRAWESGWYLCVITDTKQVPTKANDGSWFLQADIECIDGPTKGAKNTLRFNIGNKSQQAADIGARELYSISCCVGMFDLQNSSQLHMKPFRVRFEKVPAQKEGQFNNEVKEYQAQNGMSPGDVFRQYGGTAQPQQQQQQQQPTSGPQFAPQPNPAPQQAAPAWTPNGAATSPQQAAAPAAAPAPAWTPGAGGNQGGGGAPPWGPR